MAIGDVTRCVIEGRNDDAIWQVVLHYETLTSFGPKSSEFVGLEDALTEVFLFKQLTNDALDFLHQDFTIDALYLRDVDDPSLGYDSIAPTPHVGKLVSDYLPPQAAMLIRKKTARFGKQYSGRNYYPFGSEANHANGRYVQSFVDDVADWATLLLTIANSLLTFSFRLVVYSPTYGTVEPVINLPVISDTRTQRRRAY